MASQCFASAGVNLYAFDQRVSVCPVVGVTNAVGLYELQRKFCGFAFARYSGGQNEGVAGLKVSAKSNFLHTVKVQLAGTVTVGRVGPGFEAAGGVVLPFFGLLLS